MILKKTIVSSFALLPFAATLAFAGPGGPGGPGFHGRHHGPGDRLERALEELDLTAEQKEKVQSILDASKEQREERRTRMREAFQRMHTLLEQESPDEDAILEQAEKIGELKTEGHKQMLRTLLAVRAELTPEQREKLKEMKREHRGPRRWQKPADGATSGEN